MAADILDDWAAPGSEDLHGHVRSLERELGIPEGFLEGLFREPDDWSFIIKLHALIDAAVTHLITTELNREQLRETFATMQMGDGKRGGKLAFAKKLELLSADVLGFFLTVGHIRNRFAHSVAAVGSRIENYVESRPANERDGIWRSLAYFALGNTFTLPDGKTVDTVQFARENPRLATWWSAMNGIAVIYLFRRSTSTVREFEEKEKKHNEFMAETFRSLLEAAGVSKKAAT